MPQEDTIDRSTPPRSSWIVLTRISGGFSRSWVNWIGCDSDKWLTSRYDDADHKNWTGTRSMQDLLTHLKSITNHGATAH